MPADHKVSVAWQIVFTFITGLNFWAFYRIRKLRKYLVYAYIPSIIAWVPALWFLIEVGIWVGAADLPYPIITWYQSPTIVGGMINAALLGFSIYLVIKWSREHNKKYETRQKAS